MTYFYLLAYLLVWFVPGFTSPETGALAVMALLLKKLRLEPRPCLRGMKRGGFIPHLLGVQLVGTINLTGHQAWRGQEGAVTVVTIPGHLWVNLVFQVA